MLGEEKSVKGNSKISILEGWIIDNTTDLLMKKNNEFYFQTGSTQDHLGCLMELSCTQLETWYQTVAKGPGKDTNK